MANVTELKSGKKFFSNNTRKVTRKIDAIHDSYISDNRCFRTASLSRNIFFSEIANQLVRVTNKNSRIDQTYTLSIRIGKEKRNLMYRDKILFVCSL